MRGQVSLGNAVEEASGIAVYRRSMWARLFLRLTRIIILHSAENHMFSRFFHVERPSFYSWGHTNTAVTFVQYLLGLSARLVQLLYSVLFFRR